MGHAMENMRPRSLLTQLRRFVSPIHMVFGRGGHEIRAILGRSLVVERRDGDIRPVDAELVIEERQPRADGPP